MDKNVFLIANGFVSIPAPSGTGAMDDTQVAALGTVLSNMAYYGYVPSPSVLTGLQALSASDLGHFWKNVRPAFEAVTGADRNMGDFVVYKNFPREVLEMSAARYWFAQILMYWGLPNHLFTEAEQPRAELKEKRGLKVLTLADDSTESAIYQSLVANKARWTDPQREWVEYLFSALRVDRVSVDEFGFKENGILAAKLGRDIGAEIEVSTATDVLRLAAVLSGGDPALREKVRFKAFKRADRQFLLSLLDKSKNVVDDFFMRPEVWKRLLRALRPGDYKKFANVSAAYDVLYRGDHVTYAGRVETGLRDGDDSVLAVLATRPGDFLRRLHKAYAVFGPMAVDAFNAVVPKLSTSQLLKLDRYLLTINDRHQMIYAPKGNWTRAQVVDQKKRVITPQDRDAFRAAISKELGSRLAAKFPEGFKLDRAVDLVKLQTNDQKLASYGRGTVFPIPEDVTFIRSASFWQNPSYGNTWYDNGWNFFDEDWKSVGVCAWDNNHGFHNAATWSGDPTNSKDLQGRGCQMIDLYPQALLARGVRYAVWSVLCFSQKSFNEADEVLATLQWGAEAQSGKLYEPSRAQMVFPLKGDNLTKYVAYVDLKERKLVYVDANLKGNVQSASRNGEALAKTFPAFLEYLGALPSVGDLFSHGKEGTIPVLYTDEDVEISERAYVFARRNGANEFENIDVVSLLGD